MLRAILNNYVHKNEPLNILTFMGNSFYDSMLMNVRHTFHIWTKDVDSSEWPNKPKNVKEASEDIRTELDYNLVLQNDNEKQYKAAAFLSAFWHIPRVNFRYIINQRNNNADYNIFTNIKIREACNGIGPVISPYVEITEVSREEESIFLVEYPRSPEQLKIVQSLGSIPMEFVCSDVNERKEQYKRAIGYINLEQDFLPLPVIECNLCGIPCVSLTNPLVDERITSTDTELLRDAVRMRGTHQPYDYSVQTREEFECQLNSILYYSVLNHTYTR